MSCPTEGIESAAFGNNIDTLKDAIELKHGRAYRIYNLSQKPFRKEKFSQHVVDLSSQCPRQPNLIPPPIPLILKLCSHVCKFLSESPSNVVMVCCNDGRVVSCVAACSVLMFCGVVRSVEAALSAFVVKRGQIELSHSHVRYLKYIGRLLAAVRSPDPSSSLGRVSPAECILTSVSLIGVPLFNRQRWGF